MSPIRINRNAGKRKPATSPKPVTLPTFSFYDFEPVYFVRGRLEWGKRVVRLERRR